MGGPSVDIKVIFDRKEWRYVCYDDSLDEVFI